MPIVYVTHVISSSNDASSLNQSVVKKLFPFVYISFHIYQSAFLVRFDVFFTINLCYISYIYDLTHLAKEEFPWLHGYRNVAK